MERHQLLRGRRRRLRTNAFGERAMGSGAGRQLHRRVARARGRAVNKHRRRRPAAGPADGRPAQARGAATRAGAFVGRSRRPPTSPGRRGHDAERRHGGTGERTVPAPQRARHGQGVDHPRHDAGDTGRTRRVARWSAHVAARIGRDPVAGSVDVGIDAWRHDGQKFAWVRETNLLVDDEPLSPFTRAVIAADITSSLSHCGTDGLQFINADYTVTLSRLPEGVYIGWPR